MPGRIVMHGTCSVYDILMPLLITSSGHSLSVAAHVSRVSDNVDPEPQHLLDLVSTGPFSSGSRIKEHWSTRYEAKHVSQEDERGGVHDAPSFLSLMGILWAAF